MLNYVLPIAIASLAGLQLAKDWVGHQTTWRRIIVLLLIVLIGTGGAVNYYYSSRKTAKQHDDDQKQISALKQAVDTANQNQQANTKLFVDAFGKLS
jgi:predicted negative regulator of RcsB-dependent stress response